MVVNPQKFMFRGGQTMKQQELNEDVCLSSLKNFKINDSKDYIYPNIIDYRDFCLPTNNQRDTPHCVGYTVGGYLEINYWKTFHIPRQFKADEIYKAGRQYKPDTISGTRIEYCLLQLKSDNVFKGTIYSYIPKSVDQVKYAVHQYGPLMCGLIITDEWYDLDKEFKIKEKKKYKILGGHCVLCCGYNKNGVFIQNSWGYQKWGNYGFALVPWEMWMKQIRCCVFIKKLVFNLNKTESFLDVTER